MENVNLKLASPPFELPKEAYFGLAGEIVREIEPNTEAAPGALLSQLLCVFGNIVGRKRNIVVESARHFPNLFILIVGASSKARKGSSWNHIKALFEEVNNDWLKKNVKSGLSSGEGLISAIRDTDEVVGATPGVLDKRLLCIEAEFSSVLKVSNREGNILSAILRDAWDGSKLETMTKNAPVRATDPHVSIIGHITKDELVKNLTNTDISNGFANRFLFFFAQRSKLLPQGGAVDSEHLKIIAKELRDAIDFCNEPRILSDPRKLPLWQEEYAKLSSDAPGIVGKCDSRAEAQVLRLALVQALINRRPQIDEECLKSALAIHDYCLKSLHHIFGSSTGSVIADRILEALEAAPNGLTRSKISDLFNKNKSAQEIDYGLRLLKEHGLAFSTKIPTSGRDAECWFHKKHLRSNELNEISVPSSPSFVSFVPRMEEVV